MLEPGTIYEFELQNDRLIKGELVSINGFPAKNTIILNVRGSNDNNDLVHIPFSKVVYWKEANK